MYCIATRKPVTLSIFTKEILSTEKGISALHLSEAEIVEKIKPVEIETEDKYPFLPFFTQQYTQRENTTIP